MASQSFSPRSPIQPSEFMKTDIPAETDDLQLGNRQPGAAEPIENGATDPNSEPRRTGASANDPHGGRH
ncbi:hypothetical protein [Rhizobium sp.]